MRVDKQSSYGSLHDIGQALDMCIFELSVVNEVFFLTKLSLRLLKMKNLSYSRPSEHLKLLYVVLIPIIVEEGEFRYLPRFFEFLKHLLRGGGGAALGHIGMLKDDEGELRVPGRHRRDLAQVLDFEHGKVLFRAAQGRPQVE